MQNTAILSALETAATANLSPADLIYLVAETLAETGCNCRTLPIGSAPCPACREANHLTRIADKVDMHEALVLITEACRNAGAALVDLLQAITEGILDRGACTCRDADLCPTCTAARKLDDLHRELRAA